MPARRKSRQRAIQVLFLLDVRKITVEEALTAFYDSLYSSEGEDESGEERDTPPGRDAFMEVLVRGTAAAASDLDALISVRAEHWRLERMPAVDRNILRLAIYEMKELGTAPAIVIDEALELARRFSEEEAVPFLNGVLDAVRKQVAS